MRITRAVIGAKIRMATIICNPISMINLSNHLNLITTHILTFCEYSSYNPDAGVFWQYQFAVIKSYAYVWVVCDEQVAVEIGVVYERC